MKKKRDTFDIGHDLTRLGNDNVYEGRSEEQEAKQERRKEKLLHRSLVFFELFC